MAHQSWAAAPAGRGFDPSEKKIGNGGFLVLFNEHLLAGKVAAGIAGRNHSHRQNWNAGG
jgi:hypothetical protein